MAQAFFCLYIGLCLLADHQKVNGFFWLPSSLLRLRFSQQGPWPSQGKAKAAPLPSGVLFIRNLGISSGSSSSRISSISSISGISNSKISTLNATRSADTAADTSDEITSVDISYISLFNNPGGWTSAVQSQDDNLSADDFNALDFGSIFRQCAPYIAMHRSSIVVIHIPGHVLQNRLVFDAIMDDISIMHLLGVQVVIVVGVRDQLDVKVQQAGAVPVYHNGMRITNIETLQFLKETSGSARFEIESSLARGFRGRSPGQQGINVVSGNFFYTAKPLGVRDGIDFMFTGEVRRIEADNICKRLESGDVVLLTSLGYSPSGESFNVPSESLAAECASKLKAAKIIFLTEGEMLWDMRKDRKVQSLRLGQAVALLDRWGFQSASYNEVDAEEASSSSIICDTEEFQMEPPEFVGNMINKVGKKETKVAAMAAAERKPHILNAEKVLYENDCDDSKVANFKRLIARYRATASLVLQFF